MLLSELPGIPVTLHVQAENPSQEIAIVPNAVAMQVTPRNGEPFVAKAAFRGEAGVTRFPQVRDPEIKLAPREKRDLTIWSALDSTLLTRDLRLYESGEYRLQLFIDRELWNLDYLVVQTLAGHEHLADPIVSNEAVLTVSAPEGDDAAVFPLIKSLSEPRGWDVDLSEKIWSDYPNSLYAPYAVPANLRDRNREAALLEAAIAKAPTSLVADWHRLYLARLRGDIRSPNDEAELQRALEKAQYVRTLLEDLVGHAREPRLLEMAKKALSEVPTRDGLVRYLRIVRGELTDIEPEIVCTSFSQWDARRCVDENHPLTENVSAFSRVLRCAVGIESRAGDRAMGGCVSGGTCRRGRSRTGSGRSSGRRARGIRSRSR